jgi:L-threonylcarbamoyladenylate synthase
VRDEFGGSVYVLEGDGVDVGIESSIVDLSRLDTAGPVLLRPGAITAAMMADVLGTMPLPPDAAAPRASGTLKAHYAPRTTLTLAQADALPQYLHGLSADGRLAWVGRAPATSDPRCTFVEAPATPDAYAQELYRLLRRLDKEGFQRLVFEPLPESLEWDGCGTVWVAPRLRSRIAEVGGRRGGRPGAPAPTTPVTKPSPQGVPLYTTASTHRAPPALPMRSGD